jgi:hypothetical protein
MSLRLAVALVAAAFLAPARFDIARNIAARFFPQEIGDSEQAIRTYVAAIDEGIAPRHGVKRQPFAITIARLGEVGEGLV